MSNTVQLRRVARFAYGDALADSLRRDGPIPVVSSGGITGFHDIANTSGPAIVVGRKGSYGSVHWVESDCYVIDTAYSVVPTTSDIDARWLYYVLSSGNLRDLSQDVGVPGLSREAAYASSVPNPPGIEEQRRIADFLDAETAHMDQLRGALNAALLLLTERDWTSSNIAFENSGQSLQLRRLVSRWIDYRGATPSKTDSGVPLITARNLSNGRIDHDLSPEFISGDDYSNWMRRGLPKSGDVLLTTEAPLGEVAIVDEPGVALAQRIILMRTYERIDSEWVYWYFRSPIGKSELIMRGTGSTALGIKADTLRSVPIPTFDPNEKRRRIEQLKSSFASTDRLRAPILRQLDLLVERRQALITAAVTGQFDVTTARGADLS